MPYKVVRYLGAGRYVLVAALNVLLLAALCYFYLTEGLSDANHVTASIIVKELRLPRMLCAMGVGASLSVAGALMQGVFRNPLVEPYTMGLSGGAVLGVAIAFVSGSVAVLGSVAVTAGAAIGGLLSLVAVLLMRRCVGYDVAVMLMCGIMVSFVTSAATSVIMSMASREDLSQVVSWTVGAFSSAGWRESLFIFCVACVATPLSSLAGNALNVMSLGDEDARSLGVSPRLVSVLAFSVATLLTAFSVSVSGVVAFVGMAVPHFTRCLYCSDNRLVLPASGLLGAFVMLACDFISKSVISPKELPAGAVCAVLGGIMFTYLTLVWKKSESRFLS